jgi:F0F1-type ATP synthase assembly protein I
MAEPGDPEGGRKGLSGLAKGYQSAEPYLGAAGSLVGSVGLFAWLGYLLDGKLHNRKPWFFIAGAILGMIGGFVSFFRIVLGQDRRGKGPRG